MPGVGIRAYSDLAPLAEREGYKVMDPISHPSRFATLSRGQAGAIVAVTLAAVVWCVFVSLTQDTLPTGGPHASAGEGQRLTDWDFYERIVARVHDGENYYDALLDEFNKPEWNFKPTSVFNCRTPIYAWVFAAFGPLTRFVLGTLMLSITLYVTVLVSREFGTRYIPLTILLIGPFAWCIVGKVYLFTELWAGVSITYSVLSYSMTSADTPGSPRTNAVISGIWALFFRELALPYCLLALAFAVWQRHWKETALWLTGLVAFALFYGYHYHEVSKRIAMTDAGQTSQWVRFGGTAFVIGTTELNNVFLIVLPAWVAAIYLPLALLGLAGWRSPTGLRAGLTCAGYLASFAVVGQPNNAYWGLMIAPLLALGIIALPTTLRDLIHVLNPAPPEKQVQ